MRGNTFYYEVKSLRLLHVTGVDEVWRIIGESFGPLGTERIALTKAGGHYPAEKICAGEDVPAFPRSTVDGYAVKARETFGAQESLPAILELAGEVKMGRLASILGKGESCYVPTGGMSPTGADAVVMLEYTEMTGSLLNIYRQVAPGENLIQTGGRFGPRPISYRGRPETTRPGTWVIGVVGDYRGQGIPKAKDCHFLQR